MNYDKAYYKELLASGYAGVDNNGIVVDRRLNPFSKALLQNQMLGIPVPKNVDFDSQKIEYDSLVKKLRSYPILVKQKEGSEAYEVTLSDHIVFEGTKEQAEYFHIRLLLYFVILKV